MSVVRLFLNSTTHFRSSSPTTCGVMASKSRNSKKRTSLAETSPPRMDDAAQSPCRNLAIDSLRGAAILLMIVDHVAVLIFDQPIKLSTIRFATRLSLPLFAVLLGSLLLRGRRTPSTHRPASFQKHWKGVSPKRLLEITAAAIGVNLIYVPYFNNLEILASFVVAYFAAIVLGRHMIWMAAAVFAFPWDRSGLIFDYPLSVICGLVALGVILDRFGLRVAMLIAVIQCFAAIALVTEPSVYVLLFAPLATALVGLAWKWPDLSHPWLVWIGERPLTIYAAQYYVLMAIVAARNL